MLIALGIYFLAVALPIVAMALIEVAAVILVAGIVLAIVGYGPLSLRRHPTAGEAFTVAGFLTRLCGLLLIALGATISCWWHWRGVCFRSRPPGPSPRATPWETETFLDTCGSAQRANGPSCDPLGPLGSGTVPIRAPRFAWSRPKCLTVPLGSALGRRGLAFVGQYPPVRPLVVAHKSPASGPQGRSGPLPPQAVLGPSLAPEGGGLELGRP